MTIKRNVLATILAGIVIVALGLFLWFRTALGQREGPIRFVDVARQAGLSYRWQINGSRPIDILQGIGNGCAFLDYSNDGSQDVLLVGTDHIALYKGDGKGHFTDVSQALGLDKLRGHFLGCAVGDYDNDGYDDIYISGYRAALLLHNERGKCFRDVTRQAGIKPQPWGTSVAFGDIDNDGRLDLYVGNYLYFDPQKERRLCPYDTYSLACSPKMYRPAQGILYRNEGSGKFLNVTLAWGAQAVPGYSLGMAFADYNASGRQSLYVANDEAPGNLLRNDGGGFSECGRLSGTALTVGQTHAGMGVDWGDYDNDGRLDLAVGTFTNEPKVIYHNEEGGVFSETSEALSIRPLTLIPLTFGVKWLDCDNDGWLDLLLVNGQVYDNARVSDPNQSYRQPTQLFRSDQGKRLTDISAQTGPALQKLIVGRGLAVGDYDNDGRIDALVVDSEGAPLLLHNESRPAGHWLSFALIGTRSNRDGYGAMVTAAGGMTQTRLCHSDGSYLSSSDKRVHVGIGASAQAETVQVRWPSGHVDTLKDVPADAQFQLREGDTHLRLLARPGTLPVIH